MDAEKAQGKFVVTANPGLRTAHALNFSISTVKSVLAAVNKNHGQVTPSARKPRGHGAPHGGDHEITLVRRMIQDAYLRGEFVTIPKLVTWLEDLRIVVTPSALRRRLLRNGFYVGTVCRRNALKEREEVIANRRKYLATLRANRDHNGRTIRPEVDGEVDGDETFGHVNHRQQVTWNEEGSVVKVPSGVGGRLISVDTIMQHDREGQYGWVKHAHLPFKARRRTGDYHGAMNTENFTKWATSQLFPHIPRHALIILDNAPYHNPLTADPFPQPTSKKAELRQWLERQGIAFEEWLLKPALYELCRQHASPPRDVLDERASQFECAILRTPQSHPELQPIDQVWGIVKSHIAATQTGDFSMQRLQERLPAAFAKGTPAMCQNIFRHLRQEEERYWKVDEQLDDLTAE